MRKMRTKFMNIAVGVLVLMALIPIAGLTFQKYETYADREFLVPPTSLTKLPDSRVFVECAGSGRPIIFVNGMGLVAQSWERVRHGIGERYRTCIYDRAGNGYSEPAPSPRDVTASVRELRNLIEAKQIETPVILVGHSYGGLIARVFTQEYPNLVSAILLVDSAHEDMGERFPAEFQEGFKQQLKGFGLLATLNRFGVGRLIGVQDQFTGGLDGTAYKRARAHYTSVSHMEGSSAEAESWPASAAVARRVDVIPVPMTVLAVDGWPQKMMPSWTVMQQDLARKSAVGRFVLVKGADHFSILQTQRFSDVVVGELLALAETSGRSPGDIAAKKATPHTGANTTAQSNR